MAELARIILQGGVERIRLKKCRYVGKPLTCKDLRYPLDSGMCALFCTHLPDNALRRPVQDNAQATMRIILQTSQQITRGRQ